MPWPSLYILRGNVPFGVTYEDFNRNYLSLPADQNELLIKSIHLEQLLLKYKKGKAFTNTFQCVKQMARVTDIRIAEHPIILAKGEKTRIINAVR